MRELQNYIERAVVLAPGDELTRDLLPEAVLGGRPRRIGRHARPTSKRSPPNWSSRASRPPAASAENLHAAVVNRVERELIVQVMAACDNVQIKAAERLGINRNTLHKKLKEYGLEK